MHLDVVRACCEAGQIGVTEWLAFSMTIPHLDMPAVFWRLRRLPIQSVSQPAAAPHAQMAVTPKPEPKESTLPPAPKLSAEEQKELEQARNGALKTLAEHRRAIAWPIGKWPVEKRVVYTRARVYLPRTYLARYGSDVRAVYPGTDLNQFIHRHYCEEVGKDGRRIEEGKDEKIAAEAKEKEKDRTPWPNYVAAEGILARR